MTALLGARAALLSGLLAAFVIPSSAGCGGAGDSLGLVGGEKIDASLIDRDPIALLPSGVIVLSYLDAATMFQTKWGPEVSRIISNVLPLGLESNFVPERDVTRIYGGLYAMQGADFCAIVQGNFDVDAIHRAADARAISISGAPLVKTRYAQNDLYTAGNVGFTVLTSHTVLTGNETGMRRALDRLRTHKLERRVAEWMVDLLLTKNATMALAGDLTGQAAVDAAAAKIPFLGGLRIVRVLGNFQPPGMNFAGTLTYPDEASAQSAANNLQQAQRLASIVNLLSTLGFGAPIPSPDVAQQKSEVAFTLKVDESFVRMILRYTSELTRNATTSTRTP